jgi:general stress protein YciG
MAGKRGFAAMDKDAQRAIASKGGRAAHARGTAHEFTAQEAAEAGRKGGRTVSRNRRHMAEIGRKGGKAAHSREAPTASVPTNGEAMVTANSQMPAANTQMPCPTPTNPLAADNGQMAPATSQVPTPNPMPGPNGHAQSGHGGQMPVYNAEQMRAGI